MARKPKKVRWNRKRHTQAKHQVLVDYLAAWIPILARGSRHLVLIDGFAGPGRYDDGSLGSPLLMLDAYARRADRQRLGATPHFFFIEKHLGRAQALREEIAKRKETSDIEIEVIEGDYSAEFPKLLRQLRERWQKLPPIFAFIDPFGAEQNKLALTSELLKLPRCEALIFVPISHLARFVGHPDFEQTLTSLYGTDEWKRARAIADLGSRKKFLVELFQEQLRHSCRWVRAFEIVPRAGGSSHFLFFGTSNEVGLARMKTAMWKLDPVAGQTFRDSTRVDDPVLFQLEPDYGALLRLLKKHFGDRAFSIDDAEAYTLFETPFLHDAHLKSQTLAPAERQGELAVVSAKPGRRSASYPAGTRVRFVS